MSGRLFKKERLSRFDSGVQIIVGIFCMVSVTFFPNSLWRVAGVVGFFGFILVIFPVLSKLAKSFLFEERSHHNFEKNSQNEFIQEKRIINPPLPPIPPKAVPAGSISNLIREIDWFQFEKLVAMIFIAEGFQVKRLGGAQPDGGVDLFVTKEEVRYIVQCKHWHARRVGIRQMREFLGTLTHERVDSGIYVSIKGFTQEALNFASQHGFRLLTLSDVVRKIEFLELRYLPEFCSLNPLIKHCPKCESPMVLRTATKGKNVGGQFWGCTGFSRYPKCRFTLNI